MNDTYVCEGCHKTFEVTPAGEVLRECPCVAPLRHWDPLEPTDESIGEIASLRASIADPATHPIDRAAQREELHLLLHPQDTEEWLNGLDY